MSKFSRPRSSIVMPKRLSSLSSWNIIHRPTFLQKDQRHTSEDKKSSTQICKEAVRIAQSINQHAGDWINVSVTGSKQISFPSFFSKFPFMSLSLPCVVWVIRITQWEDYNEPARQHHVAHVEEHFQVEVADTTGGVEFPRDGHQQRDRDARVLK